MKIAVCVSHVPDTASKINIADSGKEIDPAGITYIINPYDEFAVEEALKTKEFLSDDSEVIAISIGTENNKDTIKKALATGVDRAVLLKTDAQLDSLGVAKALADEIKVQGCELVFMGKQSVDYDNQVVGQMTSTILDYSCVSVVVDFKLDGNNITCEREIEGGKEVVAAQLPCIITTQKGLNEPRYASLKGIMAAKRKTIEEKEISTEASKTEVLGLKKPADKNPGRILGTDSSAIPELVRLLREEAKVI